jgi:hypothetical protein
MASNGERFWRIKKPYSTWESRRQAFGLLALLMSPLLTLSGLNAAISSVVGHALKHGGVIFCCAEHAGATGLRDRV